MRKTLSISSSSSSSRSPAISASLSSARYWRSLVYCLVLRSSKTSSSSLICSMMILLMMFSMGVTYAVTSPRKWVVRTLLCTLHKNHHLSVGSIQNPIRKIASTRLSFCSCGALDIYSYECKHSTNIRQYLMVLNC